MTSPTRKPAFSLILTSLALALCFLGYPNYVIRPTRPQGAKELLAALFVLRFQHIAELVCAVVVLGAVILFLRSKPARGSLIGAIAATTVVFVCAALSRVNIYEFMFHPEGTPSFQPVREARLDGKENVLAVNTRAYPIRTIAYHHIVNDVEGGIPIAVTY